MQVRLYDAARTPAHWLEIVQPGQFSVFILEAKRRAPRPGDSFVEITPDFESAVKFAEDVVARDSSLCCEIYDHRGKSGEPLRTVYNPAVRGKYEGRPLARREMWTGAGILAVAACFIAYDVKRDLLWLWGYIIGLKLTLVGGSILVRGFSRYLEGRSGS